MVRALKLNLPMTWVPLGMEQQVSLWLVPTAADKDYLTEIIQHLAKQYQAPLFTPHLTLAGRLPLNLDTIELHLSQLAQTTSPFLLRGLGLDHSAFLFRTLFIKTERAAALLALRQHILMLWPQGNNRPYQPHISLIYKKMAASERIAIAQSLILKAEYQFNQIAMVCPRNETNAWEDIDSWEILEQWDLCE